MPICQKCNESFPNRKIIDGKERFLNSRKYCLKCSPFGKRKYCGPNKKHPSKIKIGNKIESECRICNKQFITKTAQKQCPACKSKKQRNEKRIKAVEYLGGKCVSCGYCKNIAAFDFHHRHPSKKEFTLAGYWERSWNMIQKELDKCDLLCSNCHRELHATLPWPNGMRRKF